MADHLGDPISDPAFTHDGLAWLLRSARFNYLLGSLYQTCKLPGKALAKFKDAAGQTGLEQGVWAWKASQQLPGFQADSAKRKLESILEGTSVSETSSRTGWWLYNDAMLDRALGHAQKAASEFRQVLLYPDQMLTYHLTRLALSESSP